jgi:hypothetical protein
MRKTFLVLGVLLLVAGAAVAQAERAKALYKTVRLSYTQVGISCTNGADPTGTKIGELLIISCGR